MRKKIRLMLDKKRSFTFMDLLRFFAHFMVVFLFFGIELTGQTVVALRSFRLSTFHWLAIGLFSLLGVAVTYVREYTIMKSKERKVIVGKVIGELLEGLLVRYKEYAERPRHERREFVKVVLRYIEKAIEAILKERGYPVGEISSNIMVVDRKRKKMSLEYFGTFKGGREKISLPIECQNPLPGAPAAYCQRKPVYIENTLDPQYNSYFKETKPYRSIISYPIRENPQSENGKVIAILNIDSDLPDQFVSGDFIAKRIIPQVKPFIALLLLQQDLIKK